MTTGLPGLPGLPGRVEAHEVGLRDRLRVGTGVQLHARVRTGAWPAERLRRPGPSGTLDALAPTQET